jgi:hypothetical protein
MRKSESESALRRAYHNMFRRWRDQIATEIRDHGRDYMAPDEVDALAWRKAQDAMDRMLLERKDARVQARKARRRGEAA